MPTNADIYAYDQADIATAADYLHLTNLRGLQLGDPYGTTPWCHGAAFSEPSTQVSGGAQGPQEVPFKPVAPYPMPTGPAPAGLWWPRFAKQVVSVHYSLGFPGGGGGGAGLFDLDLLGQKLALWSDHIGSLGALVVNLARADVETPPPAGVDVVVSHNWGAFPDFTGVTADVIDDAATARLLNVGDWLAAVGMPQIQHDHLIHLSQLELLALKNGGQITRRAEVDGAKWRDFAQAPLPAPALAEAGDHSHQITFDATGLFGVADSQAAITAIVAAAQGSVAGANLV